MPKGNPPAPRGRKPKSDRQKQIEQKQAYQKIYDPVAKGQGAADKITAGKIPGNMSKGKGQVRGSQSQSQPTKNKAVKKTGVTRRKK